MSSLRDKSVHAPNARYSARARLSLTHRRRMDIVKTDAGGVAERLKATVLKTVRLERVSGVRIPPPPICTVDTGFFVRRTALEKSGVDAGAKPMPIGQPRGWHGVSQIVRL